MEDHAPASLTHLLVFLDPPKIISMRLLEKTPTSLSLSWDVSPRRSNRLQPVRYELTYRKKVRNFFYFFAFVGRFFLDDDGWRSMHACSLGKCSIFPSPAE